MQFLNSIFNNNERRNRRNARNRSNPTQSSTTQNRQQRNDTNGNNANRPQPPQMNNPFEFFQQFMHQPEHAAAAAFGFGDNGQTHTHDPQQPSRAAPPADSKAIRQLPVVSVSPEDLVDENNRECCICFEENKLHDKVMRLPCAHIYHPVSLIGII